MQILLFSLLAAATGTCIALQATANSKFRQNIDSPAYAAFFSICGTIATASLLLLLIRPPVPTWSSLRQTDWWNWMGGPLGAMIVLAGATLAKELGAAAFIALVVAGQLLCSMILDHFALMGLAERTITPGRIIGAFLVVLGVVGIKYW
jgi:transporter family-2 protein